MMNADWTSSDASQQIMGIWKVGPVVQQRSGTEICLAQPADSPGNPRFDYVLKRSLPDADPHARQTITQQFASCQQVRHPNLICTLDGSVSGQQPYVVMPRIDGQDLQAKLTQSDRIALPIVLWLVRQTAQAIEALHTAGWIHGDIKPANILVSEQGHVTLMDLGFAAKIHTPMGRVFRGTPDFASPEMLGGNVAALPAMDVFALGRTLWMLLTATPETSGTQLEPVADLIEEMVDANPQSRPRAGTVINRLLRLELETLGNHIVPPPAAGKSSDSGRLVA